MPFFVVKRRRLLPRQLRNPCNPKNPRKSVIKRIQQLAAAYAADVVALRQHLHAHPELSFKETNTAAFVTRAAAPAGPQPAADCRHRRSSAHRGPQPRQPGSGPARRHGRAADSGAKRSSLQIDQRGRDARLRARRAHGLPTWRGPHFDRAEAMNLRVP